MGCYIETYGMVEVKDCADVQVIIVKLKEYDDLDGEGCIDIEADERKKILRIDLAFSGYCSYTTASKIEKLIKELGQYAIKGTRFFDKCDEEDGFFYVGNEEQIVKAQSEYALVVIRQQAKYLIGEDIGTATGAIEDVGRR